MIAPSVLGPAVESMLATLLTDGDVNTKVLSASGEVRIYDHTPPRPVFPYLRVESAGELSLNTMGPRTAAKWGSTATVRVRVVSQFRGEREISALSSAVRNAVDGQRITIEGFAGRPRWEYFRTIPLEDSVNAIVTREWLMEFELCVHQ